MAVLTRVRRMSQAGVMLAAIALVLVYLQDVFSLRLQHQPTWCRGHFGTPARFDYLFPDRSERITAGVTDFWGWFPPGMSCAFTDTVTKESETLTPAADRSYVVVILVVLILVSSVSAFLARRRGRS